MTRKVGTDNKYKTNFVNRFSWVNWPVGELARKEVSRRVSLCMTIHMQKETQVNYNELIISTPLIQGQGHVQPFP